MLSYTCLIILDGENTMNFLDYCEVTVAGLAWVVTLAAVVHYVARIA